MTIQTDKKIEVETIRINYKDYIYQIKETEDGLKITELTNLNLIIKPETTNSIIILKQKKRLI